MRRPGTVPVAGAGPLSGAGASGLGPPIGEALPRGRDAVIAIGPEGDFSPAEIQAFAGRTSRPSRLATTASARKRLPCMRYRPSTSSTPHEIPAQPDRPLHPRAVALFFTNPGPDAFSAFLAEYVQRSWRTRPPAKPKSARHSGRDWDKSPARRGDSWPNGRTIRGLVHLHLATWAG